MRLFILLFLAFCFSTYAQDIAVKAISKTTVETDTFVGVDEYKSLYHIKDNIFYKKEKLYPNCKNKVIEMGLF